MKKDKITTIVVTAYLIVYTILFHAGASLKILACMFLISPFLVIWMAYSIMKHGTFKGRELQENEEWGYGDKERSEFSKSIL